MAARRGVVSTDRLIEDLWRGQPPPSATASLQAYVSKLRRLLEPGRSPRAPARLLVSAPPGYVLRVPDEQVDAWRFEGLVRQAGELVLWLTRCGGRGWRSPSRRRTHSSSTATGTARRPPGRSEGSPTRRRCTRLRQCPIGKRGGEAPPPDGCRGSRRGPRPPAPPARAGRAACEATSDASRPVGLTPRHRAVLPAMAPATGSSARRPNRGRRRREQTGNRRTREERPAWHPPRAPAFGLASAS